MPDNTVSDEVLERTRKKQKAKQEKKRERNAYYTRTGKRREWDKNYEQSDKGKACHKRWRDKNPDKVREYNRRQYEKRKEKKRLAEIKAGLGGQQATL